MSLKDIFNYLWNFDLLIFVPYIIPLIVVIVSVFYLGILVLHLIEKRKNKLLEKELD